jgi:hypothetical protein
LCGKTLTPGVYATAAACVLSCQLTLDADGATDPKWTFECGGALGTAAGASVVFKDGIGKPEDVSWEIGGATATGAGSTMIGDLTSVGAITLGADTTWTGSLTSSAGAVGTGAGSIVKGSIKAEGAITLGANARSGCLTSTNGAITLGAGAERDVDCTGTVTRKLRGVVA